MLSKGDELAVRVVEVDRERGRIGLRLADDPDIAGKSVAELAGVGTGGGGGGGRGQRDGGGGDRRPSRNGRERSERGSREGGPGGAGRRRPPAGERSRRGSPKRASSVLSEWARCFLKFAS